MFDKVTFCLMIALLGYSLLVFFSLIKRVVLFHRSDELQKKIFFETLSISMGVILSLHLIQLILSIVQPAGYQPVIYSGGKSMVRFTLGAFDHVDSFLLYCMVIAVVYNIRRVQYGLISKSSFLVRNLLPMLIIFLFLLLPFF
ncbi:hypothetical protein [Candidatus Enterococcus murrayae]|uniref:Uncharacterized protein n=1 Tax=Candidatus Enterococcus murrayae TaxID=2815321 RepID=A0ABS3HKU2_9ENTE|nr:hypothetical protein [Enterococcus sp. MJM16]MBO0453525.1 hypothetical protein [Enterococcus sp. MJM16]